MKIIDKNILEVDSGMIFQSCNAQLAMNSGLAKQIRGKWPIVYEEYIKYLKNWKNDFERLGKYHYCYVNDNLIVCNVIGQLYYGYNGVRFTDYSALNTAFFDVRQEKDQLGQKEVYFPFNFGCDRGGADWKIVSKMIEFYFPNAIICKLPDAHA